MNLPPITTIVFESASDPVVLIGRKGDTGTFWSKGRADDPEVRAAIDSVTDADAFELAQWMIDDGWADARAYRCGTDRELRA